MARDDSALGFGFLATPPPDFLGSFPDGLMLSVENVARPLEGSVNLVESVVVRGGPYRPGKRDFRSARRLGSRIRARPEAA
ncbi:hypothetical protein [Streptomyces sp. NPDC054975]